MVDGGKVGGGAYAVWCEAVDRALVRDAMLVELERRAAEQQALVSRLALERDMCWARCLRRWGRKHVGHGVEG
jgi:hypothetical protein